MKNEKLIEILKKEYDSSSNVVIHLHFGQGLAEKLVVAGYWNDDYGYTMECTNYWKRGNLITKYHDVSDLIELLSEKNVSEITHKDFTDIELEETISGYLELDKITWDKPKPSKKLLDEEGFDHNDLYNTGEITDSEYEFQGPDSLFVELRNKRDTLHISEDGYKFTKGPRVKKWTAKNKEEFEKEYTETINNLVKLHEKYELILEEGLTENHPDVSWQHETLTFANDKVKLELDTKYVKWNNESLELTLINEVGARFVAEISGIENILRLRNEMIKKADELICLNSTKASQIDEIWEPPVEEDNTSWDSTDDDDDYDSSDNTDDENENLEEED
jgi:hypothetical protein